jgi:hypothetical protein
MSLILSVATGISAVSATDCRIVGGDTNQILDELATKSIHFRCDNRHLGGLAVAREPGAERLAGVLDVGDDVEAFWPVVGRRPRLAVPVAAADVRLDEYEPAVDEELRVATEPGVAWPSGPPGNSMTTGHGSPALASGAHCAG